MIVVKVHKKENKTIVAACDSNLLGQRFEEGTHQLDLTGDFYKGEIRDKQEIGDLLRNADAVNLVGEKSVALGLEEEVIDTENVMRVKGVPFAQAILIHN